MTIEVPTEEKIKLRISNLFGLVKPNEIEELKEIPKESLVANRPMFERQVIWLYSAVDGAVKIGRKLKLIKNKYV